VKDLLVDQGYDPNLGARPLRRAVQRFIEDPLSEELLLGRFHSGDTIYADLDEARTVIFTTKAPPPPPKQKQLVGQYAFQVRLPGRHNGPSKCARVPC
jgi:ATP-dependent Clp protease ATP-binding subunit ClpC